MAHNECHAPKAQSFVLQNFLWMIITIAKRLKPFYAAESGIASLTGLADMV